MDHSYLAQRICCPNVASSADLDTLMDLSPAITTCITVTVMII